MRNRVFGGVKILRTGQRRQISGKILNIYDEGYNESADDICVCKSIPLFFMDPACCKEADKIDENRQKIGIQ